MKIKQILLDCCNPICHNGVSIGERIVAHDKMHLWDERASTITDIVVVHYISAIDILPKTPFLLPGILQIFVDYGVSSHYLISRQGGVYQLVPEGKRAWHCGPSRMPYPDCREGVNEFSIGIELMGTKARDFTSSQYRALTMLCCEIESRYKKQFKYVGHDQIAGAEAVALKLRAEAKVDPGPLFEWSFFFDSLGIQRAKLVHAGLL